MNDLKRPLSISFTVHLLIFFSLWWLSRTNLFFSDVAVKNATLIKSSVKVDIVAMPKFTPKELKAMQVAAEPDPPPAPKAAQVNKVQTGPDFKSRLQKLSKKTVPSQAKSESSKKATKSNDGKWDDVIAAGNKLSKGRLLYGDEYGDEENELADYVLDMKQKIQPNWKLPRYLMNQKLKAQIRIFINNRGEVTKVLVYNSSGNEDYDQRAKSVVLSSSPFAPPEVDHVERLAKGSIVLQFNEEGLD